jgi:hypothetical protein
MPTPLAAAAGAYDDDPGAMRRAMLAGGVTGRGGAGPFGGEIAQTGQGGFQALPEPTVASTPMPGPAPAQRRGGGGIGGFLKRAVNPLNAVRGVKGVVRGGVKAALNPRNLNPRNAMSAMRGIGRGALDAAQGYGPVGVRPENQPERIAARKAAMQSVLGGGGM